MTTRSIACLLLLLLPARLFAQAQTPPPGPPPVWSGKGELSLVATSGNTDTQTIATAAEVEYKPGRWSWLAKGAFLRSQTDEIETARSLSTLLRAARALTPRLEGYGQFGYLKNTFAGLDHRVAAEGGLGYEIIARAPHSLKARAGLGFIREERLVSEDLLFPTLGADAVYKWKFSPTAEFSEEPAFTANLEASEDWRFTNAASLTAALNSILSLKLTHALNFLNRPVPGFEKTDRILSAALVFKF